MYRLCDVQNNLYKLITAKDQIKASEVPEKKKDKYLIAVVLKPGVHKGSFAASVDHVE